MVARNVATWCTNDGVVYTKFQINRLNVALPVELILSLLLSVTDSSSVLFDNDIRI